jgi:hypothetical protein
MLHVAEPPNATAKKDEEDKDSGKGAEDFVLPELDRLPQLGEFIAELLDLELEVGVAGDGVIKVAVFFPFLAVGALQGAALGLVADRVALRRIIRKVETRQRRVARATVAGEQKPRLFLLRPGVKELELGVRDSAIVSVDCGRLRAEALANDLDEPLAEIDLVT